MSPCPIPATITITPRAIYVEIYSQDIGMVFGMEKYAMLVMKRGKQHMTEGVEQPNQVNKTFGEQETYKYLEISEADTIKQMEMKEKLKKKEYLRRTRKLLETKFYCSKLLKGIYTWVVPLVRYSGPFFKLTREELKQMDQRTRKLITMHKALHPRYDFENYMNQEEMEDEDFPSLKTTWTHRDDD